MVCWESSRLSAATASADDDKREFDDFEEDAELDEDDFDDDDDEDDEEDLDDYEDYGSVQKPCREVEPEPVQPAGSCLDSAPFLPRFPAPRASSSGG